MKRILFCLILITLTAFTAFAQMDLQPAAIVNLIRSEPITVRQVRLEVERLERAAGRSMPSSDRMRVLDAIINERLVLQAAERDRISVSENEVNSQIDELRNQMRQQIGRAPTEAEFAQAIRSEYDMDMPTFRDQARRQMVVQKYLMAKKGDLIQSITAPTEAEIQQFYELNKAQLVRPDTVRFSMIMVPYGSDAAARTRARELADRLFREIGGDPAKFDEVSARGMAPNSGYQAGDAGFIPRNQEAINVLGQSLFNAVFSTRQGQVSNVVEGPQGFYIIKVTENHAMRNLQLDDIFQLGTRITVRQYIGQGLLQQKQQEILTQASNELITELRRGNPPPFTINESYLNW